MSGKSKNNKVLLLPNPFVRQVNADSNPSLLRIIWTSDYLQIDFGYPTRSIYINGGWVNFGANAYLEDIKNGKKYQLIDADNIVLSPDKVEFDYNKARLFFSIKFEPIPLSDAVYNLFESDGRTENDFFYTGIHFDPKQLVEVI